MDDKYSQIFTAVYGAIIGSLLSRETNWYRVAVVAFTGSGFALFVVPYLCERIGIISPRGIAAAGFLGGLLGYTILVSLLKWVQTHHWIELVMSKFTNKDGE